MAFVYLFMCTAYLRTYKTFKPKLKMLEVYCFEQITFESQNRIIIVTLFTSLHIISYVHDTYFNFKEKLRRELSKV